MTEGASITRKVYMTTMSERHSQMLSTTHLVLALELLDEVVDKTVVKVLQAGLASTMGGGVEAGNA